MYRFKGHTWLSPVPFLLILILYRCASSGLGIATSDDVGKLQWMLNNLRTDLNALEKRVSALEARLPEGQDIKQIQDSQKATAKSVSDLLFKTQSLTTELQRITGRLEELSHSQRMLNKRDEAIQNELAKIKLSIADMKKRLDQLTPPKTPEEAERPQEAKTEKKTDDKGLYMSAYETFKAGKMDEARRMFNTLLREYPDSEYADNARFWIGETYYKEGKYEDAILAYEELFRKNPDSEKVPGAMLKQGLAFYALKDRKTGRLILERLIEKFPDSEQARIARKKLKEH
jgi:tol-pal system protein YbgF